MAGSRQRFPAWKWRSRREYGSPDASPFPMSTQGLHNLKQGVKRLEEVSISGRGVERVHLLRRRLVALKEIERILAGVDDPSSTEKSTETLQAFDESKDNLDKRTPILEAPNDEEVTLLQGIFGLCLTGGKEVHDATLTSIQNLTKSFPSYEDEVLAKRDELLQFAQGAIAGLKINANLVRSLERYLWLVLHIKPWNSLALLSKV